VVLVHMPLGHGPADHADETRIREQAVLSSAVAVVTTSSWTRGRLVELYRLPSEWIHVAHPGVDEAGLAAVSTAGGSLLCVAAVTLNKGHDLLVDALATVSDVSWRCVCVGSLDRDPAFVADVRRRLLDRGIEDRVDLPGPRTGADLDRTYAAAD